MKRDLHRLATIEYDLVVVGGGIYGACIAWDAVQRGLSVALVEQRDFGHATSANSLKTVHGGLRYLQDGNLRLVRKMIRERAALARVAPHLVHPLPCLMPTYKTPMRSKLVMAAALLINDIIGTDRNRGMDPQKHLPRGKVIGRDACLAVLPEIDDRGLTGGAIWYDYQMYNTERLALSFVLSAAEQGGDVANYVAAAQFLQTEDRVWGIRAQDMLTGDEFDVRAKVVVNAAGPWVNRVLGWLNGNRPEERVCLSTAMNLVTRQLIRDYAVGIPSRHTVQLADGTGVERSRMLFIAPWRGYSIIGTDHAPYGGCPPGGTSTGAIVTEEQVQCFLDEVNRAYPGAQLTWQDIYFVHQGFLPAEANSASKGGVKLVREGRVYDHRRTNGIDGLVTVVGVKYTTARYLAEKAVDLVFEKLRRQTPTCTTSVTPLIGGDIERYEDYLAAQVAARPANLSAETVQHLIFNYGSRYRRILKYIKNFRPEPIESHGEFAENAGKSICMNLPKAAAYRPFWREAAEENPLWRDHPAETAQVIGAEAIHAVREEMAQTLADVVLRRTELGSAAKPDQAYLRLCAGAMAAELGWNDAHIAREIEEVESTYAVATRSIEPIQPFSTEQQERMY